MKKFKFILFFSFCLFYGYNYAQDVIFTKAGAKLRCKIVNEDSTTIYFFLPHESASQEIKKSEVLNYSRKSKEEPAARVVVPKPMRKEVILLNLCGGGASPLKDYANKDANSSTAGLATNGSYFQASMVLKLSQNIGVCAAYHYQVNGFSDKSFNDALTAATTGVEFTTTSTNWNIRGFFGGLYLTLPIKDVKGLSLFANGYAGLPKYVTPAVTTVGVNMIGSKVTVTQDASSTSAFGAMLGGGLLYKFFDGFGINLSANYFSGKAEFSDVYVHSSNGSFSYSHFTQKFASLNIQAGVTFAF